ncbi:MAG: CpaF family protein [Gammaproteobacteria bacterium]|nr:CpaF family protein [Gammaproteobacteria bacterium]MDE2250261.1 CpaF family protein [Gammaproteobacteria bacterium]
MALARQIQEDLRAELDLRRTEVAQLADAPLRELAWRVVRQNVARRRLPPDVDPETLARSVIDEALGYGPLEPMLADPTISEVMVNGHAVVYVERHGRIEPCPAIFSSEQALRSVIDRIVAGAARRVDESSPMVDARLPDGSRVNVVLPPLALNGPCMTIRRFSRLRLDIPALVRRGALSESMARFLGAAVRARLNVMISGGTGSGKTTLLNAIAGLVPAGERIITIEDAAELALHHNHVVALEARPRNLEGHGEVTIRDLVRNALRMRPDRIIVGECRGGEALDMLQAMNSGHEGSLTTAHANSARDLLSRLEVMALMAGMDLPVPAIRAQIAGALDLLVHTSRAADGVRRVSSIVEVVGCDSGIVQTQELYACDAAGIHHACGQIPACIERLRSTGMLGDSSLCFDHPGNGNLRCISS